MPMFLSEGEGQAQLGNRGHNALWGGSCGQHDGIQKTFSRKYEQLVQPQPLSSSPVRVSITVASYPGYSFLKGNINITIEYTKERFQG